ncbi:MAG: ACT domain-containing protein [Syntrophomonadales bacterium]
MKREKKFYLVREDMLPEAILKTARAKELMAQRGNMPVTEALEQVGLPRSTFYKYRDGVFSFLDAGAMRIINLSLELRHEAGILSKVLNYVASQSGNILAINQNLPLRGMANVTLSVDIEELRVGVEELLAGLEGIDGVLHSELIGRS